MIDVLSYVLVVALIVLALIVLVAIIAGDHRSSG